LFFLPDALLVVRKRSVTALDYHDVDISLRATNFIEDESVPRDANVVCQTWRFVAKNGGPDRALSSTDNFQFAAMAKWNSLLQRVERKIQYCCRRCDLFLRSSTFCGASPQIASNILRLSDDRHTGHRSVLGYFAVVTGCVAAVAPLHSHQSANPFQERATGRASVFDYFGSLGKPKRRFGQMG
jgi:hypothetical protein